MPKRLTWHCDDGFSWTLGEDFPDGGPAEVLEHVGSHPGMVEPSLAWSLHQAGQARRALLSSWAALIAPQLEWVVYHLSRFLTRHR